MPETRGILLEQLAEKGFGSEPLAAMQKVVSAEDSDIYDVLAFVAFASAPVSREARAAQAGKEVQASLSGKPRAFIAFVLEHYVKEGVEQLDVEKLAPLLRLEYGSIEDATANLGPPAEIRRVFVEFQRYLYQPKKAA